MSKIFNFPFYVSNLRNCDRYFGLSFILDKHKETQIQKQTQIDKNKEIPTQRSG